MVSAGRVRSLDCYNLGQLVKPNATTREDGGETRMIESIKSGGLYLASSMAEMSPSPPSACTMGRTSNSTGNCEGGSDDSCGGCGCCEELSITSYGGTGPGKSLSMTGSLRR